MSEKKKPEKPLKKMFWVDLEMTGLDDNVDKILEIAVIITDINFTTLEEYHRIVYQPKEVLDNMNDWCKLTHGKSGLTAKVPTGTPLETVDQDLFEIVTKHYSKDEKVVLCGNSVNNDKRFIDRYMPKLASRLHYRLVDVTSFKEVFRARYGVQVQKKDTHRALDDILESINELKAYLQHVNLPLRSTVSTAESKDSN